MQKKVFFLACIFITVSCLAQQYPFVHYTPKDGLINSRVRKAYQDSKGRMYFITYGGLSVYDGARFRNYTTQNGLSTLLVNDILEVGDDSLLVTPNDCGLNMLVHGQMKKITITGEYCPIVNNLLKSHDGNIYCTADDGLYKLVGTGFEKLSIIVPGRTEPAVYLGAIVEYRDLLIFTTNDLKHNTGLFLYDKKKNLIIDALLKEHIYNLKKDPAGKIWISTDNQIRNLDTTALLSGKLSLTNINAGAINSDELSPGSIAFNRHNELFVATAGEGIMLYRKDGPPQHIILPEQPGFVVQNFLIDREDVLWICHDGNGVYKLPNTKLQSAASYYGSGWSGIQGALSKTPDTCWSITNNGQVLLHSRDQRKVFTLDPFIAGNTIFYNDRNLYTAVGKRLYMAPLPLPNEKVIRFRTIFTLPDTSGFGGRFVSDPYGNTILFESRNICVFQDDKLLFTYPMVIYDLLEGFYIDRNKDLWVVTRGYGLQIFSIHPETPSQYLKKKSQYLTEFEGASPRCITVDKNEMLWVGTRHNGLMAFEHKNDKLLKRYHFQAENGLTDNFVVALASDKENNILAGTQTGLDRLIKTKEGVYRIENVTKSNNVFSFIVNVWTDAANRAFALTNAGTVFQVEPVTKTDIAVEPQLLIEEIKINGKLFQDLSPSLRLQYDQRNITFSVAAPSFIDERQVKYSYLLSGSGNNKWSDTSSVADITLLNLSPGSYTLQVKAFFLSTAYTPKELSFSFSILPPWWQTWWFRTGIGILIAGILIAGIRFYYRRKLEKQKTALEKLQAVEKERTRIATDMHDDLGAGLSRIKFLSETIGIKKQQQQSIDEDITSIREYSHEMIGKMGEIVWALNEKNDSLNDLLSYTRSYAVEYLSQNGIECTVNTPEHVPEYSVNGEFRRNIYLSVKEALHNIVKHSQAKQATITMETGKNISIIIQDDGIGYTNTNKPYSNGIMNMKQRMKSINGSFDIENSNGTTIKLSAPVLS